MEHAGRHHHRAAGHPSGWSTALPALLNSLRGFWTRTGAVWSSWSVAWSARIRSWRPCRTGVPQSPMPRCRRRGQFGRPCVWSSTGLSTSGLTWTSSMAWCMAARWRTPCARTSTTISAYLPSGRPSMTRMIMTAISRPSARLAASGGISAMSGGGRPWHPRWRPPTPLCQARLWASAAGPSTSATSAPSAPSFWAPAACACCASSATGSSTIGWTSTRSWTSFRCRTWSVC
mmetsp:Transcript_179828/g.570376  ORF Transcript_179828/g.570376 Transcript_179828/m.570376 type:complete len:232 (-) Transcript_179828:187-882(-)